MKRMMFVILLLVFSFCLPAMAQVGDKAAAEALFDAGKALMKDRKYAEACPKLAESQRLDPAPGTLLNLADCYEQAGLSASAWATWLEAAAAAKDAGQSKREELARQRAMALKSRLVSITINVPESVRVQGLEVTRDGIVVGLPMWGTSVPVDPGMHTIFARAPQRKSWQTTVSVVDGVQPVQVTVPALERDNSENGPIVTPNTTPPTLVAGPATPTTPERESPKQALPQAASAPRPTATVAPGNERTASAGNAQRILGYVSLGIGAVGATVGTIYGIQAKSKNSDSRQECTNRNQCSQHGIDLRDEAFEDAKFSTIGFSVGIVGIVTGAALLLTAPSADVTRTAKQSQTRALDNVEFSTDIRRNTMNLVVKGVF
jgi:hypothetical protein